MPAQTIDEVIVQLERILADCKNTGSTAGYFTALYHKVTCRVKDGILKGEFEDNTRMERLDVIFANRYLTAYEQWKNKQLPSTSWVAAFEGVKKRSTIVLQHLLLGINAHINLDLGIAAVETMKGGNFTDIQKDFNAINTLLAAMIYEVMHDLSRISPLLSLLGLHATNNNQMLVEFTLSNARDGAWCFAEEISKQSGTEYDTTCTARDKRISELGESILHPHGAAKITLWFVHLFEWQNARKVIEMLGD